MLPLDTPDAVYAAWTRLGFSFALTPSRKSPDLERLILATARFAPDHPRLFLGAATWLSQWWTAVARLRLRQLTEDELEDAAKPVLGALLEEAARLAGGRLELLEAAARCSPARDPKPLFSVERGFPALEAVVKAESSPAGRKWGRWFAPVECKDDVLFTKAWVLSKNPSLAERTVRRGDLRASILATLRLDQKEYPSESALADHFSASRVAVRKSLDALENEGFALRHPSEKGRGIKIRWQTSAAA